MIYRLLKITGANGFTLVANMLDHKGKAAVEIMTPFGEQVILTKEQFQQLNGWVETEFARHDSTIRYTH